MRASEASEASERGLMGLASEASKVRACSAVCVETAFSQYTDRPPRSGRSIDYTRRVGQRT